MRTNILAGITLLAGVTAVAVISVGIYSVQTTPYVLSQEKVQEVYDKIYAASGEDLKNKRPIKWVEDNDGINAYATYYTIVVFKGLGDAVKNDDELALVIGHELSHITMGHILKKSEGEESREHESLSDKMGSFYMMKAGYNVCKGRGFFLNLQKLGMKGGISHPNTMWRYNQLNVGCGGDMK